ncbi:MAG: hypothetical protein CVU42_00980 [Chloroflexi bacterium HGW-Chloroflexi-4]|nr:MAG: hypothetical protein CVU42_00980 [Chloroflexi bacterium HGW-Chloroflexi-4]
MELIERYLNETGKHLPRKNRVDILAEIRSHLEDTLDERTNGKPSDDDVVALLKETGSPQKMAASYAPQGQYVVGPALFPLWRMVTGIALAAVLGAQLLAGGIAVWMDNDASSVLEFLSGMFNSIPMTVGWVVIVFMILQAKGVNPKLDEDWNPRDLPAIEKADEIKRGELIAGIVFGSLFLALVTIMPEKIGVYSTIGGEFFANPIILQYLPLIILSLGVNIGLDIYLLWHGRWNVATRAVQIGANIFSIVVLTILFQAHSAWLTAHDAPGFLISIERLSGDLWESTQLIGMEAFRMAFGIALVVTVIETIVLLVKMIVGSLKSGRSAEYSTK